MRALTDAEKLDIALDLLLDHEVDRYGRIVDAIEAGNLQAMRKWDHCLAKDLNEWAKAQPGYTQAEPNWDDERDYYDEEPEGPEGDGEEDDGGESLTDSMTLGTTGDPDKILVVGQRVKVVALIDDVGNRKHLGQVGTIVKAHGRCTGVDSMPSVQFADGYTDAFWPEELEVVDGSDDSQGQSV